MTTCTCMARGEGAEEACKWHSTCTTPGGGGVQPPCQETCFFQIKNRHILFGVYRHFFQAQANVRWNKAMREILGQGTVVARRVHYMAKMLTFCFSKSSWRNFAALHKNFNISSSLPMGEENVPTVRGAGGAKCQAARVSFVFLCYKSARLTVLRKSTEVKMGRGSWSPKKNFSFCLFLVVVVGPHACSTLRYCV